MTDAFSAGMKGSFRIRQACCSAVLSTEPASKWQESLITQAFDGNKFSRFSSLNVVGAVPQDVCVFVTPKGIAAFQGEESREMLFFHGYAFIKTFLPGATSSALFNTSGYTLVWGSGTIDFRLRFRDAEEAALFYSTVTTVVTEGSVSTGIRDSVSEVNMAQMLDEASDSSSSSEDTDSSASLVVPIPYVSRKPDFEAGLQQFISSNSSPYYGVRQKRKVLASRLYVSPQGIAITSRSGRLRFFHPFTCITQIFPPKLEASGYALSSDAGKDVPMWYTFDSFSHAQSFVSACNYQIRLLESKEEGSNSTESPGSSLLTSSLFGSQSLTLEDTAWLTENVL